MNFHLKDSIGVNLMACLLRRTDTRVSADIIDTYLTNNAALRSNDANLIHWRLYHDLLLFTDNCVVANFLGTLYTKPWWMACYISYGIQRD